jgi:hypothetical protein
MQFSADAVRRVLTMLEPGAADPAAAHRLAEDVGSWPELLAHLLLRRDSLKPYPDIEAALRTPAERFRGGPLNRRPRAGPGAADMQFQERSQKALEVALDALLAAERVAATAATAAGTALRDHVLAHPRHGFDLHHRIQTDAG